MTALSKIALAALAALLIFAGPLSAQSRLASSAQHPNIVLILADDFGYECVAANGGESYRTPNLDRLAAGGTRFEHCYAQPLCTPTRVQLMTGQLNVRNYVRFGFLDPNQPTFAHLLNNAGYATGIFGKWQLSNGKEGPGTFGFDEDNNGTAGRLTSRWKGQEIKGAKSKTTDAGTRVPLIVNWPGRVKAGHVVTDLVDTTDFLPTIAEATQVSVPDSWPRDGRSFLPQAKGEKGNPREWLYSWYAPNQQKKPDTPVEVARTHRFKLFGDGRLFELDGRYGEKELDLKTLSAEATQARDTLSRAIAQYANARPESLKSLAPSGDATAD